MSWIYTYCLTLLWCASLHAADFLVVHTDITVGEAIQLARESDKKVMAYFYYDQCESCRLMEDSILSDRKLSAYLNSNFIIAGFNTSRPYGQMLANQYEVSIHPTLLFLDHAGRVDHQLSGIFTPEALLRKSADAFTENSLSALHARFNLGENSRSFMLQYINALANAHQLSKNKIDLYLKTPGADDYTKPENMAFIYRFALHHFEVMMPYHEPALKYMLHHADKFYAHFDSAQVKIRLSWILLDAMYEAMEAGDHQLFNEALAHLRHFETGHYQYFRESDGSITGALMNKFPATTILLEYHKHNTNHELYRETLDHYISLIWDLPYELNSMARELLLSDDPELIQRALSCTERSIALKQGYDNTETYALLLLRTDQLEQARSQAEKALEFARLCNLDPSGAELILSMIKQSTRG